jgi:shikimate dehydrogenase
MIYTLDHLRNWREAAGNVDPPIRLGIFGDPVEHSLSPEMQNAALRHCGMTVHYGAFHIRANELAEALSLAQQNNFLGLNLTVPHKIAALPLMNRCDEIAKKIGAINTVKMAEGEETGFNTDAVGFSRAVREMFSVDLRDLRVLLLGAGGGGRAIAWQCALENCERFVIANRDLEKAKALIEELRPHLSGPRVLGPVARVEAAPMGDDALRFQIANTDLLVNATNVGLSPAEASPIAAHLLAPHLFVIDTVYRDGVTPLVRAAEAAGARAGDGRTMLLHQGALAFEIWFNRAAPIEVMRAELFGSGAQSRNS